MSYIQGVTDWLNSDFIFGGKTLPGEEDCGAISLKGNYISIKTDHRDFKESIIDKLFNRGKIRCICDYIIISDNLILVCELKSNNEGDYKIQLSNTGKFIKYFLSMVKEHNKILAPIPTIKYVCFANKYKSLKQTQKALDSIDWKEGKLFKLPCNTFYHLNQFN
jgi:hypothetical protein